VNGSSADQLAKWIFEYGEEPGARRVARSIASARESAPILTTGRLAEVVSDALGGRRGKIHPATRTFQALRIAVNDELAAVEQSLEAAMSLLKPGGRLVVISFHSLEDRLVKQCMTAHVGREESLAQGGSEWRGRRPKMKWILKKPVMAGDGETGMNPRARSAKMRAAERLQE
jgi:16S rRNA (cytosine1402-N4)-methyltransferase